MPNYFYISLLSFLIVACSNPREKLYSEETFEEDLKELKNKLDTSESQLLIGTILRYSIAGKEKELTMMSYEEIIQDGLDWKAEQDRIEKEQKELAEKMKREEEERTKRLTDAMTVSCYEKKYVEYNYQKYIAYKFAFENKTDRDIQAITGLMIFNDLFDKEITQFTLTYDEGVNAGKTATWNATTDYNQFIDEHVALRSKDLDKLKVVWKPEKILFKDGSTLE